MKNLEESKPDSTKNWRFEIRHCERLASEISVRWKNWRERRKCELTNSPGMNWEKVMLPYRYLLHKCRSCREEWIVWMILDNFKMWNRFAVENYPSFPVNRWFFQVLLRWAKFATWCMKFAWYIGKRFWQSKCSNQGILHSWNQSATGENPVRESTGKPVARSEWRNRESLLQRRE